jgi:hypothetical protein
MTDPEIDLSPVQAPEPDPDVDPAHEQRGTDDAPGAWRDEPPATDAEVEALTERRWDGD